tara:strand:+ start:566 stop:691 length:126 start_codon:yes stop_codon:yes gene_type:complete
MVEDYYSTSPSPSLPGGELVLRANVGGMHQFSPCKGGVAKG